MPERFPKAEEERDKCVDFLQGFGVGGELPYRTQLQEIANRERKVLTIQLDDVAQLALAP